MSKKAKLLEQIGEKFAMHENDIEFSDIPLSFLTELKDNNYQGCIDYRTDIAYHSLENIIMMTFIAILANCNEWTEIHEFSVLHEKWFKQFLDLRYGIPSVSTFRKTMALVDYEELENICVKIIIEKTNQLSNILGIVENTEKEIIAYDGKVCKGSKCSHEYNREVLPTNAMSAFNVTKDIPLTTKFISEKTNEIPTGPKIIKLLDLTNTISTFVALNTPKKNNRSDCFTAWRLCRGIKRKPTFFL